MSSRRRVLAPFVFFASIVLSACAGPAPAPPAFVDATCHHAGDAFVLAEGEDQVTHIALHGDYVYWSSSRGPRRIHRNGGAVEDLAIADASRADALPAGSAASGLYVDDSYVYFGGGVQTTGFGIWRVPLTGGDPVLHAAFFGHGAARDIAGDDRWVWAVDTEHHSLFRIEKRAEPGATTIQFANGGSEDEGLAIDDTRVFWANRRMDKDGYGFATNSVAPAASIAVIADVTYYGYENGTIARIQRDGTSLSPITTDHVSGLVAHSGHLFWARPGPDGGYGTAAPDGTALRVMPSESAPNTHHIAAADDAVYLVSHPPLEDRIVKVCR